MFKGCPYLNPLLDLDALLLLVWSRNLAGLQHLTTTREVIGSIPVGSNAISAFY